jgi:quercetin dioxygenase-like cupin family protein
MKRILATALSLTLLTSHLAHAQQETQISPNGSRESTTGAPENFTGTVTVTPLFSASDLSNATGAIVEFTPGARTAWHTHPAGQTIIIVSGAGWVQQDGGEKIEVKAGDVVQFPPEVRHWHGATATTSMSHIAISPVVDESNVAWLEPVSDEDYAN